MRLENLKQDFPKMPEELRERIEREVQKQIGTTKKVERRNTVIIKKSLIAAFAAVMLLATTVFAGVIYQMRSETKGKYGVNIKGSVEPAENVSTIKMEVSYLPEGMVETEDGKYSYQDALNKGGVSICFYHIDTEDAQFDLLMKNVIENEDIQIGTHDGVYLKLHENKEEENSFNQRIYVAYTEFSYVMEMYVASDVSKQEALKIAEGIQLLSDSSEAKEGVIRSYSWSDYITSQTEQEKIVNDDIWQDQSVLKNTHKIGEAFLAYPKEEELDFGKIEIKVTDVQISDQIELLNLSKLDADFKREIEKEIDTEGKLLPTKINYIKYGDGIQTVDQIVDSREVPQKLVYATVEYTNIGEEELSEVLFLGSLVRIIKEGTKVKMYNGEEAKEGSAWDCAQITGAANYWEMWYYDVHGGEKGNNYIMNLKPGETETVHMAWIVSEEELEYLYLSFDTYGGYELSERALEIGYVDIRQ